MSQRRYAIKVPAFCPAGRAISRRAAAADSGLNSLPQSFQVLPSRIYGFDQLDFLAAPPAFDFLFAGYCSIGIEKALVMDELRQVVTAREARYQFVLVLPDSIQEIARDV